MASNQPNLPSNLYTVRGSTASGAGSAPIPTGTSSRKVQYLHEGKLKGTEASLFTFVENFVNDLYRADKERAIGKNFIYQCFLGANDPFASAFVKNKLAQDHKALNNIVTNPEIGDKRVRELALLVVTTTTKPESFTAVKASADHYVAPAVGPSSTFTSPALSQGAFSSPLIPGGEWSSSPARPGR